MGDLLRTGRIRADWTPIAGVAAGIQTPFQFRNDLPTSILLVPQALKQVYENSPHGGKVKVEGFRPRVFT